MSQFKSIIARATLLPGLVAALAIAGASTSAPACDKDTLDAALRRNAEVSLGAFGQDLQQLNGLQREKFMLAGGQFTATSVGNSSVVITDGKSSDAIAVHIHDDDVKIKINGEEIPADRIVRDGDKITILDKDGKVQKEIQVLVGTGDGAHAFAFGGVAGGGQWDQFFADENAPQALRGAIAAAAGPPPKVMLGVTLTEPGDALESHLKLEPGTTTMLGGLYEGLPAHAAGLAEFDIITKVDGTSPADPAAIRKVLAEKDAGSTVVLTVIHAGGQPKDVTVTLEAFDAGKMTSAKFIGSAAKTDRLMRLFTASQAPRGEGETGPQAYSRALRELRVAPDGAQWNQFRIAPRAESDAESAEQHRSTEKIEQRLQDLDKRMADLDALIRKLLEEKAKSTRP